MKTKHVIGGIAIAVFIAIGAFSLRSSLTPYVSFDEARESSRTVQIAGALVDGAATFVKETGAYEFTLRDPDGGIIDVSTLKSLPSNFSRSTTVVAIGIYTGDRFEADRILVKCPSKYERERDADVHPGERPE